MIEQQQADAGKRVAAFLADEAVKSAFIDLEKRYFADFKNSQTPAERDAVHARLCALNDLLTSALGLVDSGKLAQHALEQRARQDRLRNPRSR